MSFVLYNTLHCKVVYKYKRFVLAGSNYTVFRDKEWRHLFMIRVSTPYE